MFPWNLLNYICKNVFNDKKSKEKEGKNGWMLALVQA
jgi:hypothetical protein